VKRLSSRRQLGAVVGTVVLVGAGGWFAGTQVQSPADAAAAHTAPKAGPVTVAVRRQALTSTVVATGSVQFASPQPLSLAGSVGAGTSGASADTGSDGGGDQRVTKAPVAGARINEGDVLMTVNGRPVFALSGAVPMYRAVGPGASGDDVKQLQRALRRLGFDPGSISGTFRQGTATAVTHWYAHKGYQAQQPSAADEQQLGQLQQAVSEAQQALLSTTAAGSTGTPTDTGTHTDTGTSTDTGTRTRTTGTSTDADAGSGTGTSTQDGASTPSPESSTDQQIHQLQLHSAQKSLDLANAALSTFQDSYGTKVPAGEVVFFPKLPVRVDKVTVKPGDTSSGQIGTVTSSDLEVQAVVPGADAQLLKHGMAVEVTTAEGKKAEGTVDTLGAAAAPVTTDAEGSAGGSSADAASGTGSDASAAAGAAGTAGTADTDPSAPVQLRISIPDPGQLTGQAGDAVKVIIKVGASDGKVLAVPLVAIRTASDGQARVQVLRGARLVDVPVTVGLSTAGLVEVKPTGGTLAQGDTVVVGE
jgi:hypothetical protein